MADEDDDFVATLARDLIPSFSSTGGTLGLEAAIWAVAVQLCVVRPCSGRSRVPTTSGLGRAIFADAIPEQVGDAIDAVRSALTPYEQPDGIHLNGAAWLVTARP